MAIVEEIKSKMRLGLEHLKTELKSLRTGRANPAMLDHISLEVYGSLVRLKEVASISAPEPRQLLLVPFDGKNTPLIAKAIEKANLGFMPIVDGNSVRIKIPMMDENARKEMVKICHKRREESKVSIRSCRAEGNKMLKHQKNEGEITEDILKKLEDEIQKATDQFCKECEEIAAHKEKEIMHI